MLCAAVSLSRMATKARPVGERNKLSATTSTDDQDAKAQIVKAVAVAAERPTEQLDLPDAQAVIAVGHALPARGDLLHDEAKGDRGDHQIDAGEAQRRKSDERADDAADDDRKRQIDEKGHAEPLHVAGGIRADREERGVTERDLAGEARKDQQPDTDDRINENKDDLALQVGADDERRQDDEHKKRAIGPPIAAVAHQPDVLVVIGLEDRPHAIAQTFLRRLRPNSPSGRTISTTRSRM